MALVKLTNRAKQRSGNMPNSYLNTALVVANSLETSQQRILDAAVACILKQGVRATSIEDIAARAHVGRQTVYRKFGKRESLFEAILVHRFKSIAVHIKRVVSEASSFEEAVIAGTCETLKLARADKIYVAIAEAERELHLDAQMLGKSTEFAKLFLEVWSPAFMGAREDGTLRPNLDIEQAAEWLRNMHFLLAHRNDLSRAEQIHLLREFVLPGLVGRPRFSARAR